MSETRAARCRDMAPDLIPGARLRDSWCHRMRWGARSQLIMMDRHIRGLPDDPS
jgi:hypothetical protein